MSLFEAIIFGIVQGITEFQPISSTAHIVITQLIIGRTFPGLAFEVFLHLASALALIIYFRKDLWTIIQGFFRFIFTRKQEERTHFWFGVYILVATLITGVLGSILSDVTSDVMKTPVFIAITLTITGLALIFIELFHKTGNKTEETMTIFDSILVGLGQTLAVIPGLSRSGTTLVVSLLAGLNRETAVKYSFLLAIPVILGSTVLVLDEFTPEMISYMGLGNLIVAFIVTFIFSIIGIVWLISFVKKSKLIYFAIYCFVVALLVFIFLDSSMIMDV